MATRSNLSKAELARGVAGAASALVLSALALFAAAHHLSGGQGCRRDRRSNLPVNFIEPISGRSHEASYQSRKVPIRRPAANAQSPRVHAEMTRTRFRKSASCQLLWDR